MSEEDEKNKNDNVKTPEGEDENPVDAHLDASLELKTELSVDEEAERENLEEESVSDVEFVVTDYSLEEYVKNEAIIHGNNDESESKDFSDGSKRNIRQKEEGESGLDEIEEEKVSNEDEKISEDIDVESNESVLSYSSAHSDEGLTRQDTVLAETEHDLGALAEIDFGVIETGRWLLKIIGGPNNGAEYYMQAGNEYILGTDPKSCDIVFYDTSVSRQHAKISVSADDALFIEDLKSRNGVLVNGIAIEEKQSLSIGVIVNLGTTAFIIYDREGEMHTIISPVLPAIVKTLQEETPETSIPQQETIVEESTEEKQAVGIPDPELIFHKREKAQYSRSFYFILIAIIGFFVLAGLGLYSLFHDEPVVAQTQENANELIQNALKLFPAVRWTYNKANNSLLLIGHVLTNAERNQLLYNLASLKFIKNVDDTGLVIDEGVWNEVNSLLSSNRAWSGITIHSSVAGQFILSGELQTRKQAEQLSTYLSLNFPYLDLLKKQIVVEEDVVNRIGEWLRDAKLPNVIAKMINGEVSLTGSISPGQEKLLDGVIEKAKQVPGVRIVVNTVRLQSVESGTVDISDHYQVNGTSRVGNKYTVVINGRILSEGDDLDGMTIKKITANRILLEKNGDKFRIDY